MFSAGRFSLTASLQVTREKRDNPGRGLSLHTVRRAVLESQMRGLFRSWSLHSDSKFHFGGEVNAAKIVTDFLDKGRPKVHAESNFVNFLLLEKYAAYVYVLNSISGEWHPWFCWLINTFS